MSETISGVITYMGDEKKFGNYGFKVKGYDEWFRAKKRYEDILEKGNNVTLKVKTNQRGDYELAATPVVGKAASTGSKSGPSARTSGAGGEGDARGAAIQWQHSQEMAIIAAGLILTQGGFKLGAASKPTERGKQIQALIDELTVKFYTEIDTKAPLKGAADTAEDLEDEEEETEDDEGAEDGDDEPDFED